MQLWTLQCDPRHPRGPAQHLSLPLLTGEEEHLLLSGQLPQQLQSGLQAGVVEGGQGVVQQDGGLLGQAQPAYRQPDSQIELVCRPPGQAEGAAGQDALPLADKALQFPGEGYRGVLVPGEPGHIPPGQPVQLR